MSSLAAQTMELAIAAFPQALLPAGGAGMLRGAISGLSPWQSLYFECRLSAPADAVDVSVQFHLASGGGRALHTLASRRGGELHGEAGSAWRRIATFAARWSEDDDLARRIVEIGLEHDAGADGRWVETPALFAGVASDLLQDRAAVARVIEAVLPDGLGACQRMMATLEAAERHGLRAGRMVGIMLSRDAQLRCMIRHVRAESVRTFLEEVGWPGALSDLVDLLSQRQFESDATRLVLGFAPDLVADCGIEMIHGRGRDAISERSALLSWLVDQGLADPTRVAALDQWQDPITPLNAKADWPDAQIAGALTEPADVLDVFLRRFSHVKLNMSGGRVREAKAYLALVPTKQRLGAMAHA